MILSHIVPPNPPPSFPLRVFAIKLLLYLYRRGVITARSAGALLLGATVIGSAHWDKRETELNLLPFPNLVVK